MSTGPDGHNTVERAARPAADGMQTLVLSVMRDGEQRTTRDLTFCLPHLPVADLHRACEVLRKTGALAGGPYKGWRLRT